MNNPVAAETERCAQLCEQWNTTPGSRLAKEIRSTAGSALITEAQLVETVLRPMCRAERQNVVAKRLGFSTGFVCDVLSAYRGVSADFAKALGYERVVMFRKVENGS